MTLPNKSSVPVAYITPEALADILLATALNPVEISGFGRVSLHGNRFTITEIILFPQTCSIHGTEFDPTGYGKWADMMMREGRGPLINEYRLWWHSHVYAKTYFSKTDEAYIASSEDTPDEWLLSIVTNKFGRIVTRLDVFQPNRSDPYYFTDGNPLRTTESVTRESFEALMQERAPRMQELIAKNVANLHPFENILDGIFGEENEGGD